MTSRFLLSASSLIVALVTAPEAGAAVFRIADGDIAALKEAITIANSNGEDDTIELATNGTYTLTTVDNSDTQTGANGLPRLEADSGHALTINGNRAVLERSTQNGTPFFRILFVDAGANVTINRVAIRHGILDRATGQSAGAIYSTNATLTLTNSEISENAGWVGAVVNYANSGPASLTIVNGVFDGNAGDLVGGIYNISWCGTATMIIRDSTFRENYAGSTYSSGAGAIYNYADEYHCNSNKPDASAALIENCTFVQNAAAEGGAIFNLSADRARLGFTVRNSTFYLNSADQFGGAIYTRNLATTTVCDIESCTFSDNFALTGLALYSENYSPDGPKSMVVQIRNSIFQTWTNRRSIDGYGGKAISLGHDLSNDDGSGFLNGPGDLINTDAMLDPAGLQDNGGPTQTVALLPGSPAIDAADPNAPARDQRYFLRNGPPDIGAFEYDGIGGAATR